MKSMYILLMKSTTSLSRIVGLITSDKYTHVSLAFDASLNPLYSSTRKNGEDMFPAGPCREYLNRGFLGRHPFTPCALYELRVSDEVFQKAQSEVESMMEQADDLGFNIVGLIFCHLGKPLRRERKYFCSQFVSEILLRSGALKLPREACLMKPSHYMDLPELTCLFEGTIGQLHKLASSSESIEFELARA